MDTSTGWADAAELAAGRYTARTSRLRRRGYVIIGVIGAVLVLGLVPGAFFFGPVLEELAPLRRFPDWTVWTALGLEAVAIVLMIFSVVVSSRSGQFGASRVQILSALSRDERRSARRQIAGMEPLDEEHRTTILAGASQIRRATLGSALLFLAVSILYVGIALLARTWVTLALFLILFPVMLAFAGHQLRRYVVAGRFLHREGVES